MIEVRQGSVYIALHQLDASPISVGETIFRIEPDG